jgi:wyosine [tRNA(Phe)-imidazoG37] synthetase (radical SAM superfamily)
MIYFVRSGKQQKYMSGFLFSEMVFGPVKSRRLGNSLGINLLPANRKICTFNCIYCECGWTPDENLLKQELPARAQISDALEERLIRMKLDNDIPDSITFAGNGEPTIHPEFPEIIDDTLKLRTKYFPHAEVTVLSNSSTLHKQRVFEALNRVDNNILKLDAGLEATFQKINKPASKELTLDKIVQQLRKFKQKAIIQTLFLRGVVDGEKIDNTKPAEIHAWINHIRSIRPRYVMLYPIDRATPAKGLEVVSREDLYHIADQLNEIRVKYSVY